jgi:phospholipase C
VIVLENHDWSAIQGAASAPYINKTLLALGAHADNYMNVPGLHPSLPNYIWMEAGATLGVSDDAAPAYHKLTTSQHLVTLLKNAGFTWKAYQEDIPGTDCPLTNVNQYAPKHLPMIYFTDVNGGVNRNSSECIAHIRPYSELSRDLETDGVASYNFITPNLCNDMHDCSIATGDAWLAREVPKILASKAYRDGGALFVTFDESAGSDVPIGFIALSPLAKPGYSNTIRYTHSSLLRSVQEIFGVTPLLGDAANATDVSDLFRSFP